MLTLSLSAEPRLGHSSVSLSSLQSLLSPALHGSQSVQGWHMLWACMLPWYFSVWLIYWNLNWGIYYWYA